MIRKNGEYYYAPHRSLWGIWQWRTDKITGGLEWGSGVFIKDCVSKEKAKEEVYRLNGWNKNEKKEKK